MIRTLTICSLAMFAALALQAQTPTAVFNFNGGTQGAGPYIFLQGTDGNFYGLDSANPARTPTIFQITPAGIFSSSTLMALFRSSKAATEISTDSTVTPCYSGTTSFPRLRLPSRHPAAW
jgi:hypothetical protein